MRTHQATTEYSPLARALAGLGAVALIVVAAFSLGLLVAGLMTLASIGALIYSARS
ncbi:MAG: hypothetical protein AB7I23_25340 [Vicinamibacterales bacterium]